MMNGERLGEGTCPECGKQDQLVRIDDRIICRECLLEEKEDADA